MKGDQVFGLKGGSSISEVMEMKKIIHVLKSSPGATGKIVILLVIYIGQAIFRVAQSEVLNRSTEVIEYRDAWILKEVMVFACIVLAGNLIIDVLEKLCLQKFIMIRHFMSSKIC